MSGCHTKLKHEHSVCEGHEHQREESVLLKLVDKVYRFTYTRGSTPHHHMYTHVGTHAQITASEDGNNTQTYDWAILERTRSSKRLKVRRFDREGLH